MIPDKIKEILETREETPQHLVEDIVDEGVVTGSFMFAGVNDSDIDIILPPHYDIQLCNRYFAYLPTAELGYEDFRSFYIKTLSGKVLNLLYMYDDDSYNKWVRATNGLIALTKAGIDLTNKPFRVALFELLKAGEV